MVETPPQQKHQPIPPLESGDHLNRYEFERRYNAMPHLRNAELIEGVVYLPGARGFRSHAQPHGNLIGCLGNYTVATPGIELGIEPRVRLDLDNEPQPDAVMLIRPVRKLGKRSVSGLADASLQARFNERIRVGNRCC